MKKCLKYGIFESLIVLKEIIFLQLQISEGAVAQCEAPFSCGNTVLNTKSGFEKPDF